MKRKNIFMTIVWICSILWTIFTTINFLLGKANLFSTVILFICYFMLALVISFTICVKIIKKIQNHQCYKIYESGFQYLKAIHKERYKLYFTGDKKSIETYTEEIQRYGSSMLEVGEILTSDKLLSKKNNKKVVEIIAQIKILMATTTTT